MFYWPLHFCTNICSFDYFHFYYGLFRLSHYKYVYLEILKFVIYKYDTIRYKSDTNQRIHEKKRAHDFCSSFFL